MNIEEIRKIINDDIDSLIDMSNFKTTDVKQKIKNCKKKCPQCHKENVYYTTKQLRCGDEGATNIYECLECGYIWKVNN